MKYSALIGYKTCRKQNGYTEDVWSPTEHGASSARENPVQTHGVQADLSHVSVPRGNKKNCSLKERPPTY